jgi:hypothetical protein
VRHDEMVPFWGRWRGRTIAHTFAAGGGRPIGAARPSGELLERGFWSAEKPGMGNEAAHSREVRGEEGIAGMRGDVG